MEGFCDINSRTASELMYYINAWLIAKWVSKDCALPDNPLIWDVFVHLLEDHSNSTNTVVCLTLAAASHRHMSYHSFP